MPTGRATRKASRQAKASKPRAWASVARLSIAKLKYLKNPSMPRLDTIDAARASRCRLLRGPPAASRAISPLPRQGASAITSAATKSTTIVNSITTTRRGSPQA